MKFRFMLIPAIIFFFLLCTSLSAQIRLEIKEVKQIYDANNYYSINLNIFVWNLGAKTQIISLLQGIVDEWKFRGISTSNYEEIADFYIIYKNPNSGALTSRFYPASIMIKTIFDNYIPMDSPRYELASTGANSGQEWNILYTNIPKGAFDIYTKILGDLKQLADLPGADEKRKEIAEKNKRTLEEAELLYEQGKYEESIEKYTYLFFVDPETKEKYSSIVAEAYFNLAENYFNNSDYENTLEYFKKCFEYDTTFQNRASSKVSKSFLTIGDKKLKNHEYKTASINYKKALQYDPSLSSSLLIKFSSIHKSPFLYGAYSVIPGLGQLINGKSKKCLIHLGVFSIVSFLGYSSYASGNKKYDDYKLATNSYLAKSLYKEADDKRKASYIYFGVATLTMVYSVIDSYIDTNSFNNLFKIDSNGQYSNKSASAYNTIISLRIGL